MADAAAGEHNALSQGLQGWQGMAMHSTADHNLSTP